MINTSRRGIDLATDTLPTTPSGLGLRDVEMTSLEATIDARLRRLARNERVRVVAREVATATVPAAAILWALIPA